MQVLAIVTPGIGCYRYGSHPDQVQHAADPACTYAGAKGTCMSIEVHRAIVQRFAEALNQADIATIEAVLAPDLIDHMTSPELGTGSAGFVQLFQQFRAAFPDVTFVTEDMIAEGDRVVWRTTTSGTHT